MLAFVVILVAGCHPNARADGPSDVVSSLGAVPIPSAAAAAATPNAAAGHPAVLAIGGPVAVALPGGVDLIATALGPEQLPGATSARASGGTNVSTAAVITLRLSGVRGSVDVDTAELTSRDQTGAAIALRTAGPHRLRVMANARASLRVVGTFSSGAAQVTWRHGGHVLAIWTFTIELD